MAYSRRRKATSRGSSRPRRSGRYTRRSYTPRRVNIRRYHSGNPLRRGNQQQAEKCKCPGELTPSQKFMLAQIDPFDTKSAGAKIPDSNMMPSISNHDTDIVAGIGPSGTNTVAAWAFRPAYQYGHVQASPAAGSVSWGTAYGNFALSRSKATAYAGQIELTRPVAHAVRITCPYAPTTASGFVHIGLATETVYGENTWTWPTTVAEMANLQFYKRVTLASLTQTPFTVINKWLDDTAFRYSSPASLVGTAGSQDFQTDLSWATIIVMIEGTQPGGTSLSFEHLLLSEGIPQRNGVFVGSQAAPNSPATIAAVSSAQSSIDPFHNEAQQDSYMNQGMSALASGAAAAGELVFNTVALPLLEKVGFASVATAAATTVNAIMGVGGISGVNSNPRRISI